MAVKPSLTVLFSTFLFVACGCSADSTPIDLRTLAPSSFPNNAFACPPQTCATKADIDSPVFNLSTSELVDIVRQVVLGQERTELVSVDANLNQFVFVQRSALFGFPDTIRIQTVDLTPQSSIIIFSQSNYGYWDMGVNKRRVENWLAVIFSAAK